MPYKLQHAAEAIDYKLNLIDKNKNLLEYPYRYDKQLPTGLEDVGDGSFLTAPAAGAAGETIVLNTFSLLEGTYTVSLRVTDVLDASVEVTNHGFELEISGASVENGQFTLSDETSIIVSLKIPTAFESGLVIKPQIEAGEEVTTWVPYMDKIGNYVDKRFDSTNTKIRVLTDSVGRSKNSKAISAYAYAQGVNNIAGSKAYYYKAIDFTNNKIYLCKDQVTATASAADALDTSFTTPDWNVGDYVTLDNQNKYDKCAQITAINHNEVSLDKLPFSKIEPIAEVDLGFDDYSIVNVSKPEAGIVDFGKYSHAEGNSTQAIGYESHAEGCWTRAYGRASHAEGMETEAAYAAHAEGKQTYALGLHAHTEGYKTQALASCAHAEGRETVVSAYGAHAEGHSTQANGASSHAEGQTTFAEGKGSHAEGSFDKSVVDDNGEIIYNTAKGEGAHVEGRSNLALQDSTHAEGKATTADGANAHAEGYKTKALNTNTHAEGRETIASEYAAHAEGHSTHASGKYSHAEGYQTKAYGTAGHAEGDATFAGSYNKSITNTDGKTVAYTADTIVNYTHAEGTGTKALGTGAHSEGGSTVAIGNYSHTEGQNTKAYANQAHAEGYNTIAKGGASHAEGGYTLASSNYSHAGGRGTIASAEAQTAIGKYNKENTSALFIVGNGSSDTARSNAFEVISTTSGCSIKIGSTTLTETQLKKIINFIDTIE